MATVEQVAALLAVIAAAHPDRFEITDERIDVYADLLADLDITALKAATRQHLATSPHPPTVAELRTTVAALTRPALPTWGDAWRELLDQIGRVGSYGTPTWSSPLVAEAVRQFGPWRETCAMEIADTGTHRAQFRQIFEAVAARAQRAAALLPDVRALAVERGALPAPVEGVPALPPPAAAQPDAPPAPIVFADVRRYRAEERAQREQAGRAAYEQWRASQGAQDAAV